MLFVFSLVIVVIIIAPLQQQRKHAEQFTYDNKRQIYAFIYALICLL